MKEFWESIENLTYHILLYPMDLLRSFELENWTAANFINWLFMLIGFVAFLYWMKELKKYNDNDEENRDPKAHSFLN